VSGTAGSAVLEARYRRLLRTLPPEYRRDRGEEMLGVLLELAGPGQTRPSAHERIDLLAQAVRVWLRAALRPTRRDVDATLAALSVALPVLLVIPLTTVAVELVAFSVASNGPPVSKVMDYMWDWQVWALWAVAVPAVLTGMRRAAQLTAATATVLHAILLVRQLMMLNELSVVRNMGWLLVEGAAVSALLWPGALSQGRATVSTWGWFALPLAVGVGYLNGWHPMWLVVPDRSIAVVLSALGLPLLVTRPGRWGVPLVMALGVFVYTSHAWMSWLGNYGGRVSLGNPSGTDCLQLVSFPLTTFVVLRLVAVLAPSRTPPPGPDRLGPTAGMDQVRQTC
jgi:hypothetical protein